ncbi:MAG TPA: lysophospholipid acyltransferase family protein [Cyclobacteriaceae bacterium]|nr:lysophospholipid acyltransferase family protein [Cyclobacteriaceae bacterium]
MFVVMFFLKLLSRIPLPILYWFSDFLFFMSYRVVGYRRKLVKKNLKNSFPEKSKAELKSIEKEFYKNLCDYAVETLKLLTISETELRKRMEFTNLPTVRAILDTQTSIIMFASHQFNWEWLLAVGSLNHPIDFVYQQQSSKLFDDFSLAGRMRFGAYPIKREQVARESISRKSITRGIAIMADQFPGKKRDKKYWTTFLNQDTAFFQAISQLTVMLQYPVVYTAIRKKKRGYYEAEYIVIDNPPYEKGSDLMVDHYARATEKIIQENPAEWLWSHNRWKKKRPLS